MATLTITTTAAQDARIVAAFGKRLGLGRNATGAEVKAAIITYIKNMVQMQEYDDQQRAYVATPIDPS